MRAKVCGLVILSILLISAVSGQPPALDGQALGRMAVRPLRPVHPDSDPAVASAALKEFGRIPVFFIPNAGQRDDRVSFYVQGKDKSVYFTPDGVTFALISGLKPGDKNKDRSSWAVKMDFVGANPDVKPVGLEKTGAAISYFKGKPGMEGRTSRIFPDRLQGSLVRNRLGLSGPTGQAEIRVHRPSGRGPGGDQAGLAGSGADPGGRRRKARNQYSHGKLRGRNAFGLSNGRRATG
jgi:hypothetical protein